MNDDTAGVLGFLLFVVFMIGGTCGLVFSSFTVGAFVGWAFIAGLCAVAAAVIGMIVVVPIVSILVVTIPPILRGVRWCYWRLTV